MRRHRSIATKRHCSTSPVQTHKRWATCVQATLSEIGWQLSKSEACKPNHYARPGHVSFDERSYKLATLAVRSFGRLGREDSELIDQVAASIVGGTDRSSLARKGVCKGSFYKLSQRPPRSRFHAECTGTN